MLGWYLLVIILAAALGLMLGVFPGVLILGPILHVRGIINGEPFHEGDVVQIIAGPHRGTVTRIYSGWQGDSVRVDLGPAAQNTYEDVFSPIEILRVPNNGISTKTNGSPGSIENKDNQI